MCSLKLLLITINTFVASGNQCIRSYLNHTIHYISNNISNDSSIRYLGLRSSTIECQNSCRDLNYLCDTSTDNILARENATIAFDNATCEIKISDVGTSSFGTTLIITDNITSNEYIIEVEFTANNGYSIWDEAGVSWRGTTDVSNLYSYWFGTIASTIFVEQCYVGYNDPLQSNKYIALGYISCTTPARGTKSVIRVHINGLTFTTYSEGEEVYSDTMQLDSNWPNARYAAIWIVSLDVTFHSFKMIFPNPMDNNDELICAAYIYDTVDGYCYGYYGDDYNAIETSVSLDPQSDSGIIYDSDICPTADPPSQIPSVSPTDEHSLLIARQASISPMTTTYIGVMTSLLSDTQTRASEPLDMLILGFIVLCSAPCVAVIIFLFWTLKMKRVSEVDMNANNKRSANVLQYEDMVNVQQNETAANIAPDEFEVIGEEVGEGTVQ
eukprot:154133_1